MVTCLYMIAVAKFTMHIQYRFTCTFLLLCLGKTAFNGTARWLTAVLVQVISLNLPLVLDFAQFWWDLRICPKTSGYLSVVSKISLSRKKESYFLFLRLNRRLSWSSKSKSNLISLKLHKPKSIELLLLHMTWHVNIAIGNNSHAKNVTYRYSNLDGDWLCLFGLAGYCWFLKLNKQEKRLKNCENCYQSKNHLRNLWRW